MREKPEVEVGQVYRERDKRFTRYVRVDSFATKNGQPAAWCLSCNQAGRVSRYAGRGTRIKTSNLQTRFELVAAEKSA